jgi:alpha-beta hydrolase superfamily lysophospholipase
VRRLIWLLAIVILVVLVAAVTQLPALGAGGLLHPSRRRVAARPPGGCEATTFRGDGVSLKGWRCRADGRRATLIYLHGIADNRTSSEGVIRRFRPRGFDVIAYDSRAHGESDGAACTYGFFERDDLRRVVDTIPSGPIVLAGTSLGAAVALQEAAEDPRIGLVVAA